LAKIWKRLYDLRNSIAHNKTFTKTDLTDVSKLTNEIEGYLEDAISKLEEVVIPEGDIDDVVENVVSERNKLVGKFIESYREFEYSLQSLYKQVISIDDKSHSTIHPLTTIIKELDSLQVIPKELISSFQRVRKVRNTIIHSHIEEFSPIELDNYTFELEDYIEKVKRLLQVEESDHLDKVKSREIISIYNEIKKRILAFGETSIKFNKHYISFIKDRNIVDVKLQQKSIKVWINLNKGNLDDPKNMTKDVSNIGHLGNGDYEINLNNLEEITYIMGLVKQSYDFN